jgi:hypothetical protein
VRKCKTGLQSRSYSADNIQENQYKYCKLPKWAYGERRVLPTWRAVRYPLNRIEGDRTNCRLEQPVARIGRDNRPSGGKSRRQLQKLWRGTHRVGNTIHDMKWGIKTKESSLKCFLVVNNTADTNLTHVIHFKSQPSTHNKICNLYWFNFGTGPCFEPIRPSSGGSIWYFIKNLKNKGIHLLEDISLFRTTSF